MCPEIPSDLQSRILAPLVPIGGLFFAALPCSKLRQGAQMARLTLGTGVHMENVG